MWQRFLPSRNNKYMKEIKSMCETCHQIIQGGEGIEHDKGCPESNQTCFACGEVGDADGRCKCTNEDGK
jgi:uncharacterized paraquat-inducible protein A